MIDVITTLLYFFIALMLLITVHEFGHFIVAKTLGVKVLRFSLGFGKPLLHWQGRETDYVLARWPLGGYVKMLDEREAEVAPADVPRAFNRQALWIRTAVVCAGPFFNLLFAVIAYASLFIVGIDAVLPVIGEVKPGSIAARAHVSPQARILRIDGQVVDDWQSVRLALLRRVGDQQVSLLLQDRKTQEQTLHTLDLQAWHLPKQRPEVLKTLGITPFVPQIPAVVARLMKNGPAARAGIQVDDHIVALGDKPVQHWRSFVKMIRAKPNKTHQVRVQRGAKIIVFTLRPEWHGPVGQKVPVIGIYSKPIQWPEGLKVKRRYNIIHAWWPAWKKTMHMTQLTFIMLGKLVLGHLSWQTMSGPVGIAVGAGQSAHVGWLQYLHFLALVSIGLAVLNMLPIPILDGGHLLYYAIELLTGRPVSTRVQFIGFKIGLAFLVLLMGVAFYSDVMRLFF